ncbi:MAG: hypothetical protein SH848_19085 [Saprospiraceae bacterium]|nr:hypothetical protein [Saprospiraceae bacterium]
MKFILIFSLSAAWLFSNVLFEMPASSSKDSSLIYASGEGFVVFYEKTSKDFYFLQTSEPIVVPENPSLFSYDKSGKLELRKEDGKSKVVYKLGGAIFGIAKMGGENFEKRLLINSGQELSFVPNVGDVVAELACGCVSNGISSECDSGGAGSTGCEITDGGSVAGVGWTNHCQVSCSAGHYSCCNE